MTEAKLTAAIKNEVWDDDLAVSQHVDKKMLMNAYLIDYNCNIGVKTDRSWNEKENISKYKEWLPLSTNLYLPRSPVALAKRLQE
jgi:hypothetical protein